MSRALLTLLALLTFAVTVGSSATGAAEGGVKIEEAWAIPSNDVPGQINAYLIINNRSQTDVTIVGVSSPMFTSARILWKSGTEMPSTVIPIHAELYMMPGGVHVALAGAFLRPGQTIPLEVMLSGGLKAEVEMMVLAPGSEPPDRHASAH